MGLVEVRRRSAWSESDRSVATVMMLQLDPDTSARVRRLAEARHWSAKGLMQEAVQQHVALEPAMDGEYLAWLGVIEQRDCT